MDNFQHNWPPFWGYIFYFPLTLVAHLVSPPHTGFNLYGHLLQWRGERLLLECFITCWGWTALYIRPSSLSVCLVKASSSTLCYWKVKFMLCHIVCISAIVCKALRGHLRQMLHWHEFEPYRRKHAAASIRADSFKGLVHYENNTFSQLPLAVGYIVKQADLMVQTIDSIYRWTTPLRVLPLIKNEAKLSRIRAHTHFL